MAHPADGWGRHAFKDWRLGFIYDDFCLAIFPDVGAFYLAAQYVHHQLGAVAQSEDWYAKFE